MANSNTKGFGLIAAGTLGSTPATSGQGKYFIDANYGTTIYHGGQVSSSAGYVTEGQQTADNPTLGVLNGIFYNAATTLKPTWSNHYVQVTPANSEDITAFVYDNPQQLYVVSTDDTLAQAGYLETYDMNASAGSTTTGQSSATLDINDTSADAATWRLLRSAEDPSNSDMTVAYTSVVVVLNLIELQS
jgi:hypothetical protein